MTKVELFFVVVYKMGKEREREREKDRLTVRQREREREKLDLHGISLIGS